jgi:hypothetical protein
VSNAKCLTFVHTALLTANASKLPRACKDYERTPVEHAGAHILNAPLFERKYARVYLGDSDSRAAALRTQIAKGSREALEDQFWDIIERTIQSRPMEARLGGDPSVANKIRAFLLMRYYKNGQWEDRIEVSTIHTELSFYLTVGPHRLSLVSLCGLNCTTLYAPVTHKRPLMKP